MNVERKKLNVSILVEAKKEKDLILLNFLYFGKEYFDILLSTFEYFERKLIFF